MAVLPHEDMTWCIIQQVAWNMEGPVGGLVQADCCIGLLSC